MIIAPTFDELYRVAIARWPAKIDASSLHFTSPDRYLVPCLNTARDQIELNRSTSGLAILISNLDDAIFTTLHAFARNNILLRPSELRKDVVRSDLERRLRLALVGDLLWSVEDLELAKAYFATNEASF